MSVEFEKRIDRLEAIQDRVFGKLDELHVDFVTLSSKVGNELSNTIKNNAREIDLLKTTQKKMADEDFLRCKEFEVRYVRLAADINLLENNLVKDFESLKRAIGQEIREEGEAFIDNLRKHRDEERTERAAIETERRSESVKLAAERKLYIILGAVAVTIGAPLLIRILDSIVVKF